MSGASLAQFVGQESTVDPLLGSQQCVMCQLLLQVYRASGGEGVGWHRMRCARLGSLCGAISTFETTVKNRNVQLSPKRLGQPVRLIVAAAQHGFGGDGTGTR